MTLHGKEIIPIASNNFSRESTSDAFHVMLPEAVVEDIPSSGSQDDSDPAGTAENLPASNTTPSDKLRSMIRQQVTSAISLLSPSESFADIHG